jgi:hypothetical protein
LETIGGIPTVGGPIGATDSAIYYLSAVTAREAYEN